MDAPLILAQTPVDWRTLFENTRDYIMPETILTLFACLALVLDAILPREKRRAIAYVSLLGTALSAVSTVTLYAVNWRRMPMTGGFSGMLVVDEFSLVFKGIFLLGLALSLGLSIWYLDVEHDHRGEFYALMLFATVGMMFMASGSDLLTLYIALELMALPVYILVGYLKRSNESNEASMKYFLLGAFSTGLLLYGMSLLYGVTGTTNLAAINRALPALLSPSAAAAGDVRYLLLIAMILLAAGMLFKVAAAPFHMWAPDAYEGAPTPVTAFMSVGVKAASFALFARLFLEGIPGLRSIDGGATGLPGWSLVIGIAAAVTMTWGNVGALTQRNSKRLLAYSSISHAGYVLLGLLAGNKTGYTGLVIYLLVYVLMNLGAFGVIIALKRQGFEGDRLEDFNGLAQRSPGVAALMTIFLLSLGGIPPTAGFIGKFYLFYGLIENGDPWMTRLAVLAVLNTAVSAYYYLLFVKAMFMGDVGEQEPVLAPSRGLWTAVAVSAILTLFIGVYPQPALSLSKKAIDRLQPAKVSAPAPAARDVMRK